MQYSTDRVELAAYYFPEFRERQYGDRPFFGLPLADHALYEHNKKNGGWAIRGQYFGDMTEWSLGYFEGTRRSPVLIRQPASAHLTPYYLQTKNLLLDWVYLGEAVTTKLEFKWGKESSDHFVAYNAGLEYPTYPDIGDLEELVWIMEYLHDSREKTLENHGQNDLFFGSKAIIGQDHEFKLLFSQDLEYGSQYLELSWLYRINDFVRIKAKAQSVMSVSNHDEVLYPLRHEGFLHLGLHYAL